MPVSTTYQAAVTVRTATVATRLRDCSHRNRSDGLKGLTRYPGNDLQTVKRLSTAESHPRFFLFCELLSSRFLPLGHKPDLRQRQRRPAHSHRLRCNYLLCACCAGSARLLDKAGNFALLHSTRANSAKGVSYSPKEHCVVVGLDEMFVGMWSDVAPTPPPGHALRST